MKDLKYLIIVCFVISCKPEIKNTSGIDYFNDSTISNREGKILDSSRFFLPPNLVVSTLFDSNQVDTFSLKWFSANYLCFKEPILYNYYLGNENYRFLWLRSFHRPVLITIKRTTRIIINTKILAYEPEIFTRIYLPEYRPHYERGDIGTFEYNLEKLREKYPNADSIVVPIINSKIVRDTSYFLQKDQWDKFKELLDSCNFWNLKHTKTIPGLDGAHWILEGQNQSKYQFVIRWSPNDSFEKCCEYLIKLSAAKDEEIY